MPTGREFERRLERQRETLPPSETKDESKDYPVKGLHHLSKRKVKCDETKPQCQRCRKAFLICGGYSKDNDATRFVVYSTSQENSKPKSDPPLPSFEMLLYLRLWISRPSDLTYFATKDPNSTAYAAMCCVSAGYFEQMQYLPTNGQRSADVYCGKALIQLARALKDPSCWNDPDHVTAT
ncbi:hypothetical protein BDV96DRAFT_607370 [Lophiotrema nucula]|uniref:Zn(2)-C6 fungal-type domain-containing protein n=1 Tax=Lophiotrema nucula TaxID=690887 RepID=A0A6A5YHG8_9PLEO|nr:hypothetical protein BDV96DRAFT_607370 [Lophiotrema nucula]